MCLSRPLLFLIFSHIMKMLVTLKMLALKFADSYYVGLIDFTARNRSNQAHYVGVYEKIIQFVASSFSLLFCI